jgi:sugar transferase (PEP-CTERM/EpsH1 system associated)
MQVLFIAHRVPYPPNKGDKIRSFWELKTLSKQHQVDLFCFYDDAHDKTYIDDLLRYCRDCYMEKISPLSSRIRAVGSVVRGQPFSSAFFYSPTMAKQIRRALRSRSYDVIFVFSSSMAQYVERLNGTAKVLDFVDVDSDKWDQYASRMHGLRSWLAKYEARQLARYEESLMKSFSHTLVCTEAEASLLRPKSVLGKVSVLQNSLDLAYFDPNAVQISEEILFWWPYIIFTGTMDYFPNIDAVQFFYYEVLPYVRSQLPEFKFVIVGRNPPRSITRLEADPGVCVTGSVADIRPYLRSASLAVAPMRIARGVQNKILEAMAMGVPVVTTPAAAAALPKELASVLAVEADPRHFATAVVKCLQGSSPPLNGIRSAVERYISTQNLPMRLEYLLRETVAETRGIHVKRVDSEQQLEFSTDEQQHSGITG